MRGDGIQADEVVHVALEERHSHDRCRIDPRGEADEVVLLAGGDELEVGEVREELAEVGACERPRPFARGLGEAVTEPWVHAVDDERRDGDASFRQPVREVRRPRSTVSPRGDATSTNDVSGADKSSSTRSARARKPASIPSNAWKNAIASSMTSPPTTFETVRRNACAATLTAFT